MRISARCDYACKALLELAFHWPGKAPLTIHYISKSQNIPMKYLVQILIQLKQLGLVDSVRGKEGGYILTRHPQKIGLGEVMRGIGGPLLPLAGSISKESVFTNIWSDVEAAISRVLDKITFEDILNKAQGMKGAIIYQI